EVALHVSAVDPALVVAVPRLRVGAGDHAAVADLRAEWQRDDGSHWCRAYDVLPGHSRIDATALSDAALVAWGEMTARLGLALRGFAHPRARRTMLWDVQHALAARSMLPAIRDPGQRVHVELVLDEFERSVVPLWPRLRAQVVH